MLLVLNATPLIHLARSSNLAILKRLNSPVYVPRSVYEEVVLEGRRLGKPGSEIIDEYVRRGTIVVRTPSDKHLVLSLVAESRGEMRKPLHAEEAEVLALAEELGGVAVIDERVGRHIGKLHSIRVHGTIYLLILALKGGKMTKNEVLNALNRLVETGWRVSVEDYLSIRRELESL